MSRRVVIAAALALAALAATGVLLLRERRTARAPERTQATAPLATASGPVAGDSAAVVEARVAEANRVSAGERDTFVAAGWTLVDVPPPDPAVTSFDPALVGTRDDDLEVQLASTVPSPEAVGAITEIAFTTKSPRLRVLAVEALGRIRSDEAQASLVDLIAALPADDLARRQIAPLLRPRDLDDALAARVAGLLDARGTTEVERDQLAFTLAILGLRDGMSLPADVLASLSASARARLERSLALASRSPTLGVGRHPDHEGVHP